MKVILKNRYTKGQIIQKVGFSWTMFFFGALVPLFKADWVGLLVMMLINVVVSYLTYGLGVGIVDLVIACFYNKNYIQRLLQKGWEPSTQNDADALHNAGIMCPDVKNEA